MNDTKLLNQIGNLIEEKLEPIKKQLDTVELKIELVNKKVDMKIDLVNKKIDQAQRETIDALSELFHTGYNAHDKRIKKLEDRLQTQ